MSSTQVRGETATEIPSGRRIDMKLEVVVIPVADVDRSKGPGAVRPAAADMSGGYEVIIIRMPEDDDRRIGAATPYRYR
jgi:hypothetical protein